MTDNYDQCCAFQKLEKVLGKSENRSGNACSTPRYRLLEWVLICRDKDRELSDSIKRSCPLARCTFSCDPQHGALASHIPNCSFSKYGMYKCPYHDKIEAFMAPNLISKSGNRLPSRLTSLRAICRPGSENIRRALGSPQKEQRSDGQDDSLADYSVLAVATAVEGGGVPQSTYERPINDHLIWSADLHMHSKLPSDCYHELLGQEVSTELPSDAHTFLSSSAQNDLAAFGISDTDYQYSPTVSTAESVSSELLATSLANLKISDTESKRSMEQNQVLQSHLSVSRPRNPSKGLQARNLPDLRIDTSVTRRGRVITQPKSVLSTSFSEQLQSGPSNYEVLLYEPVALFQRLKSVFWNIYLLELTQLSSLPQTSISQEMTNGPVSSAELFFLGWKAVRMILNDQLPQNFWSLFSLATLAFACGQVVWEDKIMPQTDEFLEDLELWSFVLQHPRERLSYQNVIESIFVKQDCGLERVTKSKRDSLSLYGSASTSEYQDPSSLNSKDLFSKLRDGITVRFCLQFLSTFELLQSKLEHDNNASTKVLSDWTQTIGSLDCENAALLKAVMEPLYLLTEFRDFWPVFDKVVNLLPHPTRITSRQLELYLICHARCYVKDHSLYSQFCQSVAIICSKASFYMTGTNIQPNENLLQDIAAICQHQRDIASVQSQLPPDNIRSIPELEDTSAVALPVEQTTHPSQNHLDRHISHSSIPLSCSLCSMVFKGKEIHRSSNLRRHMMEQHNSGNNLLTCQFCQRQFKRKDNLKVHIAKIHAEGRN